MPGVTGPFSADQIRSALERCAAEPVHQPGLVQPFGCMVAADAGSGQIQYVSENAGQVLQRPIEQLLGASLADVLGSDAWHALNNAAARSGFSETPALLGAFELAGKPCMVQAFASGGRIVVECEPHLEGGLGSEQALDAFSVLVNRVQSSGTRDQLFKRLVDLLQLMSGYDRVMIYRFDEAFNGEVVAEALRSGMEPFLGLRFPNHDIPPQVRAIMARLPLRMIADVDAVPSPILAADATLPPLDISLAAVRGVSPVHLQYLRNMGSRSTMTLSLMVSGALWGLISFHHDHPKVPVASLRQVLTRVLPVIGGKLEALRQQRVLSDIAQVDQFKDDVLSEIGELPDTEDLLPAIAPPVIKVLQGCGASFVAGGKSSNFGEVPGPDLRQALLQLAHEDRTKPVAIDNLSERFPELADQANGIGGALVYAMQPGRMIGIFRTEIPQQIAWAGDPKKTLSGDTGDLQLMPRGSFLTYLEQVEGACERWSEQDHFFMRRVWEIVNTVERQALSRALTRQQSIMIDELNHRVRNVMALIRSISRQARRQNSAAEPYAAMFETRLDALAAAHDLANSMPRGAIDLRALIQAELSPFDPVDGSTSRVVLNGTGAAIAPDRAPTIALILHELTSNAAKHGALSVPQGRLEITLEDPGGEMMKLAWRESGGPRPKPQDRPSFGMTLIREAIPYELNGRSDVRFREAGLEVDLFLPKALFDGAGVAQHLGQTEDRAPSTQPRSEQHPAPVGALLDNVLVLEDDYLLALDLSDMLHGLGARKVVKFARLADAMDYLARETPSAAVLDVTLGEKETSTAALRHLLSRDVPVVLVSGRGSTSGLPEEFHRVPRLTKPVHGSDVLHAFAQPVTLSDPLNA